MQHESYASRPDPCENRNFVGGKALSGETGPHTGFRLCLLAMGWLKAVFFFFPRDISKSYFVCGVFGSS